MEVDLSYVCEKAREEVSADDVKKVKVIHGNLRKISLTFMLESTSIYSSVYYEFIFIIP